MFQSHYIQFAASEMFHNLGTGFSVRVHKNPPFVYFILNAIIQHTCHYLPAHLRCSARVLTSISLHSKINVMLIFITFAFLKLFVVCIFLNHEYLEKKLLFLARLYVLAPFFFESLW